MKIHQDLLQIRHKEKQITSEILDKLQTMEDGRDYLKMGFSSLFDYLVRGLQYSEATAYQRQACVRLTKEVPEIKAKIDQGALTVSSVTALYKHIRKKPTHEKRKSLQSIENKSTREVKRLFLEPARPIQIKKTIYQDRVHLRLELTPTQNAKLERLKALKSHRHDLESLFERLIDKELKTYANTNFKPTPSASVDLMPTNSTKPKKFKCNPSPNPRFVPRRLRNSVLKKANYKCQYPGCEEAHFLQVDHIYPVRKGGLSNPENLQVLCGAHNRDKG